MLTDGTFDDDLGGDSCTRRNPDRTKQRALDQLHPMRQAVTLSPLTTAQAGWIFASEAIHLDLPQDRGAPTSAAFRVIRHPPPRGRAPPRSPNHGSM